MAGIASLERWQAENVERKCSDAVREAIWHGLDANDLKKMMAVAWYDVLKEKAELGMLELRS